jgi:hypothetical protein
VAPLSSLVRCLAGSPRLPAGAWGRLCQDVIFAGAPLEPAAAQHDSLALKAAFLDLALCHAGVPSLGLADAVDVLLDAKAFQALEHPLQARRLRAQPLPCSLIQSARGLAPAGLAAAASLPGSSMQP